MESSNPSSHESLINKLIEIDKELGQSRLQTELDIAKAVELGQIRRQKVEGEAARPGQRGTLTLKIGGGRAIEIRY